MTIPLPSLHGLNRRLTHLVMAAAAALAIGGAAAPAAAAGSEARLRALAAARDPSGVAGPGRGLARGRRGPEQFRPAGLWRSVPAEGQGTARYLEDGVLERNPFEVLDEEGVGALMRVAVERGRAARGELKLGICGEHGGEPRSVAFCHAIGLDYVSCSPYRVPLARLAAAQAALADAGVTAVAAGG